MRDASARLQDILEALARIEQYTAAGREAFDRDPLIQVWVVHHLQIIGEAARGLPQKFRDAHPEVPWPKIIAMRNILVHEYFGLDLSELWDTVQRDLPTLKRQVRDLLE